MINKRGTYRVGDQIYTNKTEALLAASGTNHHPEWDFSNKLFQSFNWQQPISESLEELYVARCRQLRETYDYLILNFSGGSDSWTILHIFLKYNIKLDEIFTFWPSRALQGKYTPNRENTDPSNILSEWDFTIKPDLDYIAAHHPEIKITINDYSDNLEDDLTESLFMLAGHHLNVGFFPRQAVNLQAGAQYSENKSVGVLVGLDKPQLHIKDGGIYGYFLDLLTHTSMLPVKESNRTIELFYWTPDMPELAIKAAQDVAFWLKANPQFHQLFEIGTTVNYADKKLKDDLVRTIVYPDWDNKKFQANKNQSVFASETDTWIRKYYRDYKFYQAWEYYIRDFTGRIDKKYLRCSDAGTVEGYVGFISPLYKICDL